jgi:hypothetical protein
MPGIIWRVAQKSLGKKPGVRKLLELGNRLMKGGEHYVKTEGAHRWQALEATPNWSTHCVVDRDLLASCRGAGGDGLAGGDEIQSGKSPDSQTLPHCDAECKLWCALN